MTTITSPAKESLSSCTTNTSPMLGHSPIYFPVIFNIKTSKCWAMQWQSHFMPVYCAMEELTNFLCFTNHSQRHRVSIVCLLAWMDCDWQKTDPNILERKTEIRDAAKTPPTLSHLSSSQCSRNAHIQSRLVHLLVSKGFWLNVWMLC